jgi:hypothetical protein
LRRHLVTRPLPSLVVAPLPLPCREKFMPLPPGRSRARSSHAAATQLIALLSTAPPLTSICTPAQHNATGHTQPNTTKPTTPKKPPPYLIPVVLCPAPPLGHPAAAVAGGCAAAAAVQGEVHAAAARPQQCQVIISSSTSSTT